MNRFFGFTWSASFNAARVRQAFCIAERLRNKP